MTDIYIAPIEERVKLANGKEETMLPTVAFEKFVTIKLKGAKKQFWTTVITNGPSKREHEVLANIQRMREEGATYGEARLANLNYHVLNAGIYRPAFLEEKSAKYGTMFRVVIIKFSDLKNDKNFGAELVAEMLDTFVDNATLGWSDDTGICLLTLFNGDGTQIAWEDAGSVLDLDISNSKKIAKRLNEVTRTTMLYRTGQMEEIKIHLYPLPEGHFEEAHDGHIIVSREFLASMGLHIENGKIRNRWRRRILSGDIAAVDTFRLEGPFGQLKGNATAAPRAQLEATWGVGYDVIAWEGNVKDELKTTDGSFFVTANPMHGHTEPQTNEQSLSWQYGPAGSIHTKLDMLTGWEGFMDHTEEALREGNVPAFLNPDNLNLSSLADSVTLYHQNALAARMRDLSFRWVAQGMPIYNSKFLLEMTTGALKKKMERAIGRIHPRDEYGRFIHRFPEDAKIKYPVIHATYTHVVTHEILEVAGYEIPEEKKGMEFYHTKAKQWAMPGKAFKYQFRNHGGWDLDDSIMIMKRYLGDGGKLVAVKVRMPNSYGEYSITSAVDWEDFPIYHDYGDIPILDPAMLPLMIDELEVSVQELPETNRDLPEKYTKEEAQYLLGVALDNPGVGSWVNPQIAYYVTFGTYRKVQLASTEDIVDLLTQSPDPAAFAAVKQDSEETANECIWGKRPIDEFVWETRLNSAMQITRDESGKVLSRKKPPLHDDYMVEMYEKQRELLSATGNRQGTVKGWDPRQKALVKEIWQPIQPLLDVKVPKPIIDRAKAIHLSWRKGRENDVYRVVNTWRNKWKTMLPERLIPRWFQTYAEQQGYGELNRKTMLEIQQHMRELDNAEERGLLIVALYQVCVDRKYKHMDDAFFFQNPIDGENSPFDYLMMALVRWGLATEVDEETGARAWYEEVN